MGIVQVRVIYTARERYLSTTFLVFHVVWSIQRQPKLKLDAPHLPQLDADLIAKAVGP